jgi:C-terminal processing protease CtpA/Prc
LLNLIQSQSDFDALFPSEIKGLSVNYENIVLWRDSINFILTQWKEGKVFTDPNRLLKGWDCIHPHPKVRYTKPIVLLINGLAGSCGDIFPAIMQDNQRAILIGTTTAGGGGLSVSQEVLNKFGLKAYSLTGSLVIRPNGQYIENLGVTPDIEYALSLDDLRHNYRGFTDVILSTMYDLLEKKEDAGNESDPE